MTFILKEPEKREFKIVSEGVHYAVCTGVYYLGQCFLEYQGDRKLLPKVLITWEVTDEFYDKDGEQMPCTISNEYTFSFNEKAKLREHLVSWRGKQFTEEELQGFDIRNILGVPCQLQILHKTSGNGRTYANIQTIMSYPRGLEVPATRSEAIAFDIEEPGAIDKVDELPEWIANKIKDGETYKELDSVNGFYSDPPPFDEEGAQQ